MTQAEYLKAEFLRYFPTSDITIDDDSDDETIYVHVVTSTGKPNHFRSVSWVFTAGSDDDRYVFLRYQLFPNATLDRSDVLTIPLMPEEGE